MRLGIALAACLIAGGLASCGPKNFANQNDELRREREELRARIASLETQLAEAKAQLGAVSPAPMTGAASGLDAAEVAAASPVCVALEIDRLSGLRDTTDDGAPDMLVVRLRTLDGRSRFTQVVGQLDVRASLVRVDGPTAEIGSASLGPVAVREAYRSGFEGSWYAVDVPVVIEELRAGDRVMITARLIRADGGTVDVVRVLDGVAARWLVTKKNP